jgi:ABC-type branched-subunit amino acid transport system ATPase component
VSLLEVEELRTGYGALPVLQGISFSVEEGETAVIFGLNGAGKTTTVNCLAGVLPTWSGEVRFDGKKISGKDAPGIVRAGVALSPEGRRVWPGLTVLKNLELGAWTRKDQGPSERPSSRSSATSRGSTSARTSSPDAVRRRAADAGDRSGDHEQAADADDRRGVARAVARSSRRRCSRSSRRSTTTAPRSSSWSRTSACCPTPTRR